MKFHPLPLSTVVVLLSGAITYGGAGPGPVALWRAEGNANDSVGVVNGTLVNGTTFAPGIARGESGQAFNFDGIDDEVRFPDSPALDFTTAFSVSGWMRTSGTAVFSGLIDRFDQSGQITGFQVSMSGDNGFPPNRAGILRSDFGTGSSYVTAFSSQRVDDGAPHHFAVVWNGQQATLYVDGNPGEPVQITNWVSNSTPIVLGTDTASDGRHFNGQLDEIALYNRALEFAEIQALAGIARLDIALTSPTQVTVSWPQSAEGFRLQMNDSLDPLTWTTATTEATNRVQFATSGTARFFRLIKP